MAAAAGPGGGAQENNTSAKTNSSTPSAKTAFKEQQVHNLVKQFSQEQTKMADKNPQQTDPMGEDQASGDATAGGSAQGAPPATSTSEGEISTALMTYAQRADFTNLTQDYKIRIWFRKKNTAASTTLTVAQKGRLTFKFLGVPHGKCLIFDDSKRDHINMTISGSVPPD